MKDTREMREFLIDQMRQVADGDVEVGRAKAVCNLSQQIYNTLNIEIKHALAKEKMSGHEIDGVDL